MRTFASNPLNTPDVILFFGTRTGKPREALLQGLKCPFCGQSGQMTGRVTPHYVHIFWLPVFRLKPFREVTCSHCKKGYAGPELSPDMVAALDEIQ